ncbi:MAG TPA: type IV pilin, partial [Candidatus Thermoplasmatota archaeon]|nr:type IV pilin [Candidatus Thermoplasmatota archaeon]
MSEVMGTAMLAVLTVVLLGGFSVAVLATISTAESPPTGSFTIDAEIGQRWVNVTFLDGSSFTLADADVALLLNGSASTGTMDLLNATLPGRFAPGEGLRVNLTGDAQTPGNGTRVMVLIVHRDSGK